MAAGDLVTASGHLEWRGLILGTPLSNVTFTKFDGWLDLPTMRGSDADRPSRHGTMPGQKRLGGRTVEVDLTVAYPDPAALPAIRAATVVAEDPVEEPLVIWAGTPQARLIWARIERRSIPTDWAFSIGQEHCTLQWVATDPRQYSVTEHTQSVGLLNSSGTGGLTWPLVFPLDFGTATSGVSQIVAVNAGDAATWPTLEITGPVTGPIVTDAGSGAQLIFAPTFALTAGQTLTVWSDARAVTVNGVPRADALQARGWFPLAKGTNRISFSSVGAYDVAARLTVKWRDSWM